MGHTGLPLGRFTIASVFLVTQLRASRNVCKFTQDWCPRGEGASFSRSKRERWGGSPIGGVERRRIRAGCRQFRDFQTQFTCLIHSNNGFMRGQVVKLVQQWYSIMFMKVDLTQHNLKTFNLQVLHNSFTPLPIHFLLLQGN